MALSRLEVTLKWEESATDHYVIDLISGCANSTTDEATPENAGGLGKRSRNESGKSSEDAVDNSVFSDLTCSPGKVTLVDVRDNNIFVVKDEYRKNQQRLLPAP